MVYKAIGFDWGGVINGKPGKYFGLSISSMLGISEADYLKVYFSHNKDFNRGTIDEKELWNRILTDLGMLEKSSEVTAFLADAKKISINQNVLDLIDTLKHNGYKVGLLSNNTIEGGNQIRAHGIDKHFDVFHISAETGFVKPEAESFVHLATALKVKTSELIFIDDSSKSLDSSDTVGFLPILYDNYDQCIQTLSELGIAV